MSCKRRFSFCLSSPAKPRAVPGAVIEVEVLRADAGGPLSNAKFLGDFFVSKFPSELVGSRSGCPKLRPSSILGSGAMYVKTAASELVPLQQQTKTLGNHEGRCVSIILYDGNGV